MRMPAAEIPEMINAGEVVLKRWEIAWADELAAVVRVSLPELELFMPWAHPGYDVTSAREFLTVTANEWAEGTAFGYAVFTTVGELVGSCGLMTRLGPGALEIGYWIHSDYVGRGYATRAAMALAEVGLSTQGIERVVIRHDAANPASGAVAAKAGFVEVSREEEMVSLEENGAKSSRKLGVGAVGQSRVSVTWERRRASLDC